MYGFDTTLVLRIDTNAAKWHKRVVNGLKQIEKSGRVYDGVARGLGSLFGRTSGGSGFTSAAAE